MSGDISQAFHHGCSTIEDNSQQKHSAPYIFHRIHAFHFIFMYRALGRCPKFYISWWYIWLLQSKVPPRSLHSGPEHATKKRNHDSLTLLIRLYPAARWKVRSPRCSIAGRIENTTSSQAFSPLHILHSESPLHRIYAIHSTAVTALRYQTCYQQTMPARAWPFYCFAQPAVPRRLRKTHFTWLLHHWWDYVEDNSQQEHPACPCTAQAPYESLYFILIYTCDRVTTSISLE